MGLARGRGGAPGRGGRGGAPGHRSCRLTPANTTLHPRSVEKVAGPPGADPNLAARLWTFIALNSENPGGGDSLAEEYRQHFKVGARMPACSWGLSPRRACMAEEDSAHMPLPTHCPVAGQEDSVVIARLAPNPRPRLAWAPMFADCNCFICLLACLFLPLHQIVGCWCRTKPTPSLRMPPGAAERRAAQKAHLCQHTCPPHFLGVGGGFLNLMNSVPIMNGCNTSGILRCWGCTAVVCISRNCVGEGGCLLQGAHIMHAPAAGMHRRSRCSGRV